jgi:hypothetical protein
MNPKNSESGIQRWDVVPCGMLTESEGAYVLNSDHQAVVAKLRGAMKDASFVLQGSVADPTQPVHMTDQRENALMRFLEVLNRNNEQGE